MSKQSNTNQNKRNNDNGNGKAEKKKMNPIKIFFIVVGATVGLFVLIMAVAVFGYLATAPKNVVDEAGELITLEDGTVTSKPADTSFLDELFMPPERTTVLIMGVDKSQALADVVIVATFERDTQKVDLISIPRDTKVVFTSDEVATLTKAGRKAPEVVKISEAHNYAGTSIAPEFCKQVVARMLGVTIDYYIEVNINAFRQIVDTVGGIEMDLPSGGFKYSDPEQDLYINVPGGHQKLTGEMAEGVVRYRDTYARGDLQRIEVQQEFLRQFFKQVLNKETIVGNALGFLETVIKYVKTDFPLTEMTKYIKYIDYLDAEKFTAITIPGSADNSRYFEIDTAEARQTVNSIFFPALASQLPSTSPASSTSPMTSTSPTSSAAPSLSPSPGVSPAASVSPTATILPTAPPESKNLKVQVLNGAGIGGIATAYSEKLKTAGYNISAIGDYDGTRQKYTRIMVRESGVAEDLKAFFIEAVIEIDKEMPSNVDVIVIIGSGEKK